MNAGGFIHHLFVCTMAFSWIAVAGPARANEGKEKPAAENPVWWCVGQCNLSRVRDSRDRMELFSFNGGRSVVWMNGLLQTRYSILNDDSNIPEGATVDTFSLHRARLGFMGKMDEIASFKVELNIWDSVTHELSPEEVYADLPLSRYFGVRAGLIKSPVMVQRFMSSGNLLFAEEAMVVSQKATQLKGFDASKKLRTFPSKDIGVMVYGDLFPWLEMDAFKDLPQGLLRYYLAVQNGYDMKKGSGRGDAAMSTFRLELNPFGYRGYHESHFHGRSPNVSLGFNYGKSVDLEIQDDEQEKGASLMGFDGIFAWQGVAVSGGWFVVKSIYPESFERRRINEGRLFDPSWKTEGFYVQAAAFVPLAFRNIDLRRHLELKFRFEDFDPFDMVGSSVYTQDMKEEFYPVGINAFQDRKTRVLTFGFNWYMDLGGWENRLKLSFDYSSRRELEPFRDINDLDPNGRGRLKNIQLRNDTAILQLQLAI